MVDIQGKLCQENFFTENLYLLLMLKIKVTHEKAEQSIKDGLTNIWKGKRRRLGCVCVNVLYCGAASQL